MEKLGIIDLYENNFEKNKGKEFIDKTESELKVQIDRNRTNQDMEWLEMIELTIPYIENIFRNPNRFIVNEEDIVKIEQAKKITVETIKHLSKNTNFIQTVDEVTGDVTPSKLLNVRKEESYDTYENRLIYTLVQNAKMFMNKKKDELLESLSTSSDEESGKNNKKLEYIGNAKVKDEIIKVSMNMESNLEINQNSSKEKIQEIITRIEEAGRKLQSLDQTEPYRVIDKQHITLVREPIRKTNVVLKNVNFQYAMKLWSYLRENFDGDFFENEEEYKEYNDNGELKEFIDETFLLQYMAMRTLDEDQQENQTTRKEIQEAMVDQMIEKMVDMDIEDVDRTEEKLTQMIAQRYEVIKYKKTAVIKEIQEIFKTQIEKYQEQVEKKGI